MFYWDCQGLYWGTIGVISADLGGRVGWLPKAERVKTLFFFSLQPRVRGGIGGVSRLCFFPGPHTKQPFQPTPTPSPGSLADLRARTLVGRAPSPGGPGPKPPDPWGLDPATLTMGSGFKTLGCHHNPDFGALDGFRRRSFTVYLLQHFSPKPL